MSLATPAILMQPMGLFLKSMTGEFGWTRTEFSSVISIAALCNALGMPIAGYLVDRFGSRRIIAIGTVLGCASYASQSLARSYSEFVAIMVVTVFTSNLASYPAFMSLAQRWFDERLGLALAITSTGLAVGVAGFSWLITQTIAAEGWRNAFVTAGAVALVIGLANVALLVRNDGRRLEPAGAKGGAFVPDASSTVGEALRTSDFWLYSASFALIIFAVVGCNFHLPALLSDNGASPGQIASVVGIGAAGSLFGRLFTGVMLDRFSVRGVSSVFFLGQAVGFLMLLDGMRWALPASFLLGAVQGAEIDVMGYVMARRFGRTAYARIFGICFGITLIGAIFGPLAMATLFDRTGSYDQGLWLLPLLPIAALVLLWLAKPIARPSAIVADVRALA
ncbi:MFS transporter [Novosphingobium sp.]|uniref:MFS transporter n=1 Tax=Novosphingobium sp. TaxID=1874826 RepID=UPI0038F7D176